MRKFGILVSVVLSMVTGYLMAETVSERVAPEEFWQSQSSELQVAGVSTTDTVNGGWCFDFMGSVDCREW